MVEAAATEKPKKTPPTKAPPREWTPDLQVDYDRILSVGEECISAKELQGLITAKGRGSGNAGFNLYDGFEPRYVMQSRRGLR